MTTILQHLLFSPFDTEALVRDGWLLIICLAVFAQTGLFFAFFVPSGVFLFVGGMFISTGKLDHDLVTACLCPVLAAVAGCVAGYWFGWKTGPALYRKKDTRFFKQRYLKTAELFYHKHGRLALTVGILFPVTRTFAPIIAGIVNMNFPRFVLYVFTGAVLWIPPFIVAGYLIGIVPGIKEYLPYIMGAIILLVTTPSVIRIIREFRKAGKRFEEEV